MDDKRVAVVVPYRSRPVQLKNTTLGLFKFLKKNPVDATVIVAQQLDTDIPFNKGVLMNLAASYAIQEGYHSIIFNDVDVYPVWPASHKHLGYGFAQTPNYLPVKQARIILKPRQKTAGCIFGTSLDVYTQVNGHSNQYWGWGYEDMDFYKRMASRNVKIDEQGKRDSDYGDRMFVKMGSNTRPETVPGRAANQDWYDRCRKNMTAHAPSDGLSQVGSFGHISEVSTKDVYLTLDIKIDARDTR
jgi:hypothetical protein